MVFTFVLSLKIPFDLKSSRIRIFWHLVQELSVLLFGVVRFKFIISIRIRANDAAFVIALMCHRMIWISSIICWMPTISIRSSWVETMSVGERSSACLLVVALNFLMTLPSVLFELSHDRTSLFTDLALNLLIDFPVDEQVKFSIQVRNL